MLGRASAAPWWPVWCVIVVGGCGEASQTPWPASRSLPCIGTDLPQIPPYVRDVVLPPPRCPNANDLRCGEPTIPPRAAYMPPSQLVPPPLERWKELGYSLRWQRHPVGRLQLGAVFSDTPAAAQAEGPLGWLRHDQGFQLAGLERFDADGLSVERWNAHVRADGEVVIGGLATRRPTANGGWLVSDEHVSVEFDGRGHPTKERPPPPSQLRGYCGNGGRPPTERSLWVPDADGVEREVAMQLQTHREWSRSGESRVTWSTHPSTAARLPSGMTFKFAYYDGLRGPVSSAIHCDNGVVRLFDHDGDRRWDQVSAEIWELRPRWSWVPLHVRSTTGTVEDGAWRIQERIVAQATLDASRPSIELDALGRPIRARSWPTDLRNRPWRERRRFEDATDIVWTHPDQVVDAEDLSRAIMPL